MPIIHCTFLSGTLHRAPWWAPWYSVGPLVYQGAQCPPCGVVCICVGRGAFLPKSVATVWNVMAAAHEDMTAPIARHTIVIQIPVAVHYL